ncbi:MAG TPA: hypothetical protein VED01_17210 [Burkholderiales bacterium]|nr:hypothetical protein [Burkholderiales bacterium]
MAVKQKPDVDEDMLARVAGGAAAGAGMLMIHAIAILAKHSSVDRAALVRELEALPSPSAESPSGAIYNELKVHLLKELKLDSDSGGG